MPGGSVFPLFAAPGLPSLSALLRTQNLTVDIGPVQVCKDLSLSIQPGQCWGVIGRNGVGKTTLLHVLAGLRPGDHGTVFYAEKILTGYSARQRAQFSGVVLQHDETPFPITVRESVVQGRYPHRQGWHGYSVDDYGIADRALARFELRDLADRHLSRLSGGERRRVALATVFAQTPRLFILDEPGAHLDMSHHLQFLRALKEHIEQQHCAALLVIHDLHLAMRFCDHILLLMGDGKSLQGTSIEVLDESILEEAFGHPIARCDTAQGAVFVPR